MIKKYSILFFLAAGVVLTACQSQPTSQTNHSVPSGFEKKKNPGIIEFTKEIHNFGTLKEGEIVAYSFQFKNSGGAPFRLTKVEPACGCLSVQYDKEEIENQATSAIEVIFHTEGEWGNQIKTISIETSAGEAKTLTIGAFVENKNFNLNLNN